MPHDDDQGLPPPFSSLIRESEPEQGTIVSPFLDPLEQEILIRQGLVPSEYAAIVAPVAQLQLQPGIAQGPNGGKGRRVMVFTLQVLVDFEDVLPMSMSTIVNPRTGQHEPLAAAKNAFPMRPFPMARLFVRRDALGQPAADEIRRVLMASTSAMLDADNHGGDSGDNRGGDDHERE